MSEDAAADMGDVSAENTDTVNEGDQQPQNDTGKDVDWQAEAEKWKNLARKHEKGAKTAAQLQRELDSTRQSSMTDQERAVEAARNEARAEALKSAGERLARAEIKAALSSLVDDPSEIIEDLNLSRYVTDDGDVDEEAIASLKTRYTAVLGRRAASAGSRAGHGRSGNGAKQETVADQFGDTISGLLNRA